ncbi:hypothetical protein [Aureimonas sp. SK2]|uniref:hypothetical protein n=1 Tax=Aureimonas sp. SK2 TaxID=3015992 RepID=UPI002444ABF5|nr:hypothetical protein [Aureimonas sp. SK2]
MDHVLDQFRAHLVKTPVRVRPNRLYTGRQGELKPMSETATLTRTVPSYPLRTMQWFAAIALLLWGLVLLQPTALFDREAFRPFHDLVAEQSLGAFLLGIGIVRCAALYINGHWRRTPLLRAAGAMIGSGTFAGLSALFLISDIAFFNRAGGMGQEVTGWFAYLPFGVVLQHFQLTTGLAVYPALAVFEIMSAFRCGKDIVRVGGRRLFTPGGTSCSDFLPRSPWRWSRASSSRWASSGPS